VTARRSARLGRALLVLLTSGLAACSGSSEPLPQPTLPCATLACPSASASPAPSTSPTIVNGGRLAGGSISDSAWEDVVARTLNSVLLVNNIGCGFTATGSGFVVAARTVLTNRHVVEGARSLSLRTRRGRHIAVASWQYSPSDDFAVIHAAADLPAPLPVHPPYPTPGDLVVAIGYPLSGPQKATRGRVLGLDDQPEGSTSARVIRSTSPILPGNSGGPLIDTHGDVTGVVFAIDLDNGDTLALPMRRAQQALASHSLRPGRPCTPSRS
jgi:S1-C subfamily serine protease